MDKPSWHQIVLKTRIDVQSIVWAISAVEGQMG
jgi:hypothetical protein